jgi:ribonuclease HI
VCLFIYIKDCSAIFWYVLKRVKTQGEKIMKLDIYTDGACSGNPGPGGWGSVIFCDNGLNRELSNFEPNTTNNRMELTAVITAIKYALEQTGALKSEITVTTDSKYVTDAVNQNWIGNRQRNGWKTAAKKPVMNQDLWQQLLPLLNDANHKISFTWVKGHDGHVENERCDQLAVAAIANATGVPVAVSAPDAVSVIDISDLSPEKQELVRNLVNQLRG